MEPCQHPGGIPERYASAPCASYSNTSRDCESQWAAIRSIAEKSGMTSETLRKWVRQAERDGGRRPGLSTEERDRLRHLEKEIKELRRANRCSCAQAAEPREDSA